MTSIWFPNNKYPPNTKNYLPCFVLGGGFSIRRKGLSGQFCIISRIELLKGKSMVLQTPNASKAPEQLLSAADTNPLQPCHYNPQAKSEFGAFHTVCVMAIPSSKQLKSHMFPSLALIRIALDCRWSQAPRSPPPNPAPSNHSDSLAAVAVASNSAETYGNVKWNLLPAQQDTKESHQNCYLYHSLSAGSWFWIFDRSYPSWARKRHATAMHGKINCHIPLAPHWPTTKPVHAT